MVDVSLSFLSPIRVQSTKTDASLAALVGARFCREGSDGRIEAEAEENVSERRRR